MPAIEESDDPFNDVLAPSESSNDEGTKDNDAEDSQDAYEEQEEGENYIGDDSGDESECIAVAMR